MPREEDSSFRSTLSDEPDGYDFLEEGGGRGSSSPPADALGVTVGGGGAVLLTAGAPPLVDLVSDPQSSTHHSHHPTFLSAPSAIGVHHGAAASITSTAAGAIPNASTVSTSASGASAEGPPPAASKNARRFMNPLIEKEAQEERRHRTARENRRRLVVERERVPLTLPLAVQDEVRGLGLMMQTRHARMYGGAHAAAVAAAAAGSLARNNARSQEILAELGLQWTFDVAAAASSPATINTTEKKKPHANSLSEEALALLSSRSARHPFPPLPIVVCPKIHLSNSDARVLYRSGATRTGQYGVFVWNFIEESFDGTFAATASTSPQRQRQQHASALKEVGFTPKDPFHDYILVEEAEEHKKEDEGMMIPHDLRYLFDEGEEDDDDVVSNATNRGGGKKGGAAVEQAAVAMPPFDSSGDHVTHGKRNLLTLSILRVWAHHEKRHTPSLTTKGPSTATTLTTAKQQREALQQKRSREVLIDSPRSAYVLLRNGQAVSELAYSMDSLVESKRQSRISVLQQEYLELRDQVAQRDMIDILFGRKVPQPPQRTAATELPTSSMMMGECEPLQVLLQPLPQLSVDVSVGNASFRTAGVAGNASFATAANESAASAAIGVDGDKRPHSRLSVVSATAGGQSVPRSDRSAVVPFGDGATATGLASPQKEPRGKVVLQALERRLEHAVTSQTALAEHKLAAHKQHLAMLWGRELQRFTAEREKDRQVKKHVAAHRRLTELKASGRIKSVRRQQRSGGSPSPGGDHHSRSRTADSELHEGNSDDDDDERDTSEDDTRSNQSAPAATVTPRAASQRHTRGHHTPKGSPTTSLGATHAQHTGNDVSSPGNLHLSPLDRKRAEHKKNEAIRIEQLHKALEAKELASKQSQQRKRDQLKALCHEQAARMREVQEKCERNKRTKEFQGNLMLYRQEQHEADLDEYHHKKEQVSRTIQAVQHVTSIKEKEVHEVFHTTQRELLKTMFYEAQRRIASEQFVEECAPRVRPSSPPPPSTTSAVLPVLHSPLNHSNGSNSRQHHQQHLGASVDLSALPVVNETTTTIGGDLLVPPKTAVGSRRRQWDAVVMANTKVKLTSVLKKNTASH